MIQRADGTVFTLELRQHYGIYFDAYNATDLAVTGVQVRVATEMPWVGSQTANTWLLDAHPAGPVSYGRFDAPLTAGETLTDPLGGVSVTVVSVGGGQAVGDVAVG